MIDNIKRSQDLEKELKIFLDRGGVINELPRGFSGEVCGSWNKSIIQPKLKPLKSQAQIEAEKKERKDKSFKERMERTREQRNEQKKIVGEFLKKAKKGHLSKLIKITGIRRESIMLASRGEVAILKSRWDRLKNAISTFDYNWVQPKRGTDKDTVESRRVKRLSEEKDKAIKRGDKYFYAECKHHGESRFFVYGSKGLNYGCFKCRHEYHARRKAGLKNG